MAAKTFNKRQIQVELVHQPLNVSSTVFAQHLGKFRLLCPSLQSVRSEQICRILDAIFFPLRSCVGAIDSARTTPRYHRFPTWCWHRTGVSSDLWFSTVFWGVGFPFLSASPSFLLTAHPRALSGFGVSVLSMDTMLVTRGPRRTTMAKMRGWGST